MSTKTQQIDKEAIASNYRAAMKDRLSADLIEKNVKKLTADGLTSYPAVGNVVSGIIYDKLQCTISASGEQFNGHAWGVGTPGAGFLTGDVWTSDLSGLLANTANVKLVALAGAMYSFFYFSDEDGNALGTFQALAISTVVGVGSGSGSWS
ncbi:MAG: VapA/VapB family virulence-associated protein [Bacteroidia bacterium]|nr:VapA/VapB family virulence-associated protein [Bacteroidia bacterium]